MSQREYYELQAILWPAYCPDDWCKPNQRTTTIASQNQRDEHARKSHELDGQVKAFRDELAAAAKERREKLSAERLAGLDKDTREQLERALAQNKKKRSKEERALVDAHAAETELKEEGLAERFADFAALRERINGRIAAIEATRPTPLAEIAILFDLDPARPPHHVLERGDYRALGKEVSAGVPGALSAAERLYEVTGKNERTSGRRTALAAWLSDSRNPIVSRVTVNRIWQQHFGRGIVATADNFGYTGSPPTNPELLDHLALEFMNNGWSIKALNRLILNSATYRQSSATSEAVRQIDPENLWLARFPLLRLDAESIRDSMLRASGELDLHVGGPYVPTKRTETGEVVVAGNAAGGLRRSIYLQRRRTQSDTMLDVFDAPQVTTNCTRRNASTIALQSLSLLNSEFVIGRAEAMAARLTRQVGDDDASLVREAFLLALGRSATATELAAAETFYAAQPAAYPDAADAKHRARRDLCQMLLASNAFLYVE